MILIFDTNKIFPMNKMYDFNEIFLKYKMYDCNEIFLMHEVYGTHFLTTSFQPSSFLPPRFGLATTFWGLTVRLLLLVVFFTGDGIGIPSNVSLRTKQRE